MMSIVILALAWILILLCALGALGLACGG